MNSKRLIFLIILLMVGMTGQAFAQATMTAIPSNVPKGAYVNGPLGAADDNYFWQKLSFTDAVNEGLFVVTLPTGMSVADIDGQVDYFDEISLSWTDAATATLLDLRTVDVNTTANIVTLAATDGVEKVATIAGDGDFSNCTVDDFTGSTWTDTADWAADLTNQEADCAPTGPTNLVYGAVAVVADRYYYVSFEIKNWVAGTLQPSIGAMAGTAVSGNGTYVQKIRTTDTTALTFIPIATSDLSLDNISVVLANDQVANGDFFAVETALDDWTSGADWAIAGGAGGVAVCTGVTAMTHILDATAGLNYVSFDCTAYTSGTLEITMGGATTGAITLAAGQSYSYILNDANAAVLTLTGAAAPDFSIDNVKVELQRITANDVVNIMFPVKTTASPTSESYEVDFSDDTVSYDITSGVDITFVDPGPNTIGEIEFSEYLTLDTTTGFHDSTEVDGEVYPPLTKAAYTALPDYIVDDDTYTVISPNLPAEVLTGFIGELNTTDNDVVYRVYAATDSTLAHVDADDTGVIPLYTYSTSLLVVNEGDTGIAGFTVANLPEGDWYFYVVSSITGDFSLGRSDKLTVMHWPQVDVLAWDWNATNGLESVTDSKPMTMDSGLLVGPDGEILVLGIPTNTIDLYIAVDDFDDDALVTLFYGDSGLDTSDITTSGTSPDLVVTGLGTAEVIVDSLEENSEDDNGFLVYTWQNDPNSGTTITEGSYSVYAVANDGKNQYVKPVMGFDKTKAPTYSGITELSMSIKHSPDLTIDSLDEYDLGTDTGDDADVTIDPTQTDVIMLSWGKQGVTGDEDFDDSCKIEFYIDSPTVFNQVDFGSDKADNLRIDADDPLKDTHQIIVDLVEDDEGKSDSYYAWNLKDDWLSQAAPWEPENEDASTPTHYHLYAIISEGDGDDDTERVVCLGMDGVFPAGAAVAPNDPTEISFDLANGYAKLFDPPVEGATIGPNDTYLVNFEAFDIDEDQEVGIFLVRAGAMSNLIVNGDFASAQGWTVNAPWAIGSGVASHPGAGVETLEQTINTEAVNYTVSFDLTRVAGSVTVDLGTGNLVGPFNLTGSYSETVNGGSSDLGLVITSVAFEGTIDNIVVTKNVDGTYTDGMMTTTTGAVFGAGAAGTYGDDLPSGSVYALTSDDGSLTAHATYDWLSDNTDTTYDISLWIPGAAATRYDACLGKVPAVDIAAGDYWVYIGINTDTAGNPDFALSTVPLCRAPGLLTITSLAGGNPQQNISMEPRKFVSTVGESATVSVNAYSAVAVDIMDIYIAVEQDYFDLADTDTPFVDAGFATANLIANEAINDSVRGRWVLHATIFNDGDDISPSSTGAGDPLLTFEVVGKGTDTAIGETTAFNYINEPANGYVTTMTNDGNTLAFNSTAVNVLVRPRSIIEGIVEFEGRGYSSEIVTFDLRERGSYEPSEDTSFISANDGAQADSSAKMDAALYAADGIQYRLDKDGKFTLYQIPSGDWEIYVYYQRYLAKLVEVDISAGLDSLFVDFGILLGGDCWGYTNGNGDVYPNNAITQEDVDMINEAYGSTPDSTRWDTDVNADGGKYNYKWADTDENDVVDVTDLTMATGNFTGSDNLGAQPVYLKPAVGDPGSNHDAFVEFMNVPVELKAGQAYTIQVVIDNAVNIKGYDLRMDYDRSALTFLDIEKGDFVKDRSNSFMIYSDDTIGLVNTVYGPSAFSGVGVLAEVSFKANHDGVFNSDMLGISQAMVVDSNYNTFSLSAEDAPTGLSAVEIPVEFALTQNFPNPFNPTTTISFSIPTSSLVELKIYNILGSLVKTLVSENYEVGNYSVVWDATDMSGNLVSNGVYFYTINSANYSSTKKMLFMK